MYLIKWTGRPLDNERVKIFNHTQINASYSNIIELLIPFSFYFIIKMYENYLKSVKNEINYTRTNINIY